MDTKNGLLREDEESTNGFAADPPKEKSSRRRKTSHLKVVPESRELREQLRLKCESVAASLDRGRPMSKDEMEAVARQILSDVGLGEGYVGWIMVVLSSAFWREQIQSIPHSRRLFLLPHCLKHAEGCPADYDEFGLACKKCGACSIADFRTIAEQMGYKVLVAEGSPIVLKIIVSGYVDAIVGVACLNVLEKAIDKILLAGIPCMAVPLLSSDCRNTSVDESWVTEMIQVPHVPATRQTKTYMHLLRTAAKLFEPDELERLMPRVRSRIRIDQLDNLPQPTLDPIAFTEAVAYDFLSKGGKQSRPFITLAVYDALTGGAATGPGGEEVLLQLPNHIKRVATSIETFHKASLVHDDIEDDDEYRYGQQTLHKQYGIPTAINVGDYLIGMGYRTVSRDAAELGADCAAKILDVLADAHQRLCEGQGAELFWRDALNKMISPLEALKIYTLKTAPAFEAALLCGTRLAGCVDQYAAQFKAFSRHLGVAFQILNDLKDWESDNDNKKRLCGDLLGGRPTVLWALALEGLAEKQRNELLNLLTRDDLTDYQRAQRARQLYVEAGVFELAHRLIDKHQARAEGIADNIEPEDLRRLLYYVIDTVLERSPEVKPTIEINHLSFSEVVPIVS